MATIGLLITSFQLIHQTTTSITCKACAAHVMEESKTAPMLEQPGATLASNRGRDKDGRGRRTALPIVSIILPNLKARHRSRGDGITWKYELHYIQNRWYSEYRPRYRRMMQRLKLRK